MHLIGSEQAIRRHPECRRHARAILGHFCRHVMGTGPAVEARIDPIGHAALAGEEGVADALERTERGSLQHAGHCPMPALLVVRISCWHRSRSALVHASKPGRRSRFGLATAMALNSRPIPVRSSLVRRTKAASMVPA